MEELYNYIEAYFMHKLDEGERKAFEERCVYDEAFANDVAFYIASRQAIRQELLHQKQQQWTAGNTAKVHCIKPAGKTLIQRWLPYAAAACIILAVALFFLLKPATPQQLAVNYMNQTYSQLNRTMGLPDTLQQAIEAYNTKDYKKALQLFEMLEMKNPGDADRKKYAGLCYLFTQDYDKALQQFDELAKMKGLFSNAGNFLKAAALLERDAKGDKEQAKLLLQQVVSENTEGAPQAKQWLEKF